MNSFSFLKFLMACAVKLFLVAPAYAEMATIMEAKCPDGQAAYEYDFWQFLENNARRTADYYAMENNPRATFVIAEVDVIFQMGGEHAGEYLVKLLASGGTGTALAMLRPNFDFCSDPSLLDDSREDLFSVVVAKLDGRDF